MTTLFIGLKIYVYFYPTQTGMSYAVSTCTDKDVQRRMLMACPVVRMGKLASTKTQSFAPLKTDRPCRSTSNRPLDTSPLATARAAAVSVAPPDSNTARQEVVSPDRADGADRADGPDRADGANHAPALAVIPPDLCIGCGICVAKDTTGQTRMVPRQTLSW